MLNLVLRLKLCSGNSTNDFLIHFVLRQMKIFFVKNKEFVFRLYSFQSFQFCVYIIYNNCVLNSNTTSTANLNTKTFFFF